MKASVEFSNMALLSSLAGSKQCFSRLEGWKSELSQALQRRNSTASQRPLWLGKQSGNEVVAPNFDQAQGSKQVAKIIVCVKTEEQKDVSFCVCRNRRDSEAWIALANMNRDFLSRERFALIFTPGWVDRSQSPFLWGFYQLFKGQHFISLRLGWSALALKLLTEKQLRPQGLDAAENLEFYLLNLALLLISYKTPGKLTSQIFTFFFYSKRVWQDIPVT